jgi:toxin ParE1/3/4
VARRRIRVLPEARTEIRDVLRYTRDEFGARKLKEYRELIRDALSVIAEDPSIGRTHPDVHPELRTHHIAKRGKRARHVVLYRVARDGTVEVGGLLHDAMLLEHHLPETWHLT